VTFETVATKIPVMLVVPAVTINASPMSIVTGLQWTGMATSTIQFGVGVTQGKGCFRVIELPYQPVIGVVTPTAVAPHGSLVNVVRTMTVDTATRFHTEGGRLVAAFATNHGMLADQWKRADVVVEADFMQPRNAVVAARALFPLRTLVHIVLSMTTETGHAGFCGCLAGYVTGFAGHIPM